MASRRRQPPVCFYSGCRVARGGFPQGSHAPTAFPEKRAPTARHQSFASGRFDLLSTPSVSLLAFAFFRLRPCFRFRVKRTLMLARPIVLATLSLGIATLVGCSKGPTTVPNPFSTADRVPPPATRAIAPGTAQPYYQSVPATSLPGTAPAYAPPAGAYPGLLPQASSPRPPTNTFASATPGDAISIPTDNTALRFGGATKPAPFNPRQPESLAARTATANGWISGSAPVRSPAFNGLQSNGSQTMLASVPTSTPRVRLPGSGTYNRQPVSVAALQPKTQGVRITPLPGSSDTVGWR